MPTEVRYPGRACLLGEHCDWAGGASLTVPLAMGVCVRAGDLPGPARDAVSVTSGFEGRQLQARFPLGAPPERVNGPLRYVPAAIRALRADGLRVRPSHLEISADLPAGRGFSSSAALSLAVLDALAQRSGHAYSADALAALAYDVERHQLGVPCGRLDQIACAARAPVFLEWDGDTHRLARVSLGRPAFLAVGAFQRARDTPAILATLAAAHAAPADAPGRRAVRGGIRAFATQARRGRAALEVGDLATLGDAMNAAQRAYEDMAAHHPTLAAPALVSACGTLRARGALGAKFSGAGGDGSVIALYDTPAAARQAVDWMTHAGLLGWVAPLEA